MHHRLVLFLLTLFFPLAFDGNVDLRGPLSSVKITPSGSSPAYHAFQDLSLISFVEQSSKIEEKTMIQLKTGERSLRQLSHVKIAKGSYYAKAVKEPSESRKIKSLKVVAKSKKTSTQQNSVRSIRPLVIVAKNLNSFKVKQNQKVDISDYSNHYLFKGLGEGEELTEFNSLSAPTRQKPLVTSSEVTQIPTTSGTPIIVSKKPLDREKIRISSSSLKTGTQVAKSRKIKKQNKGVVFSQKEGEGTQKQKVAKHDFSESQGLFAAKPVSFNWGSFTANSVAPVIHQLTGTLTLSEGLIFDGEEHSLVVLHRVLDSEKSLGDVDFHSATYGKVDYLESNFSINIKELFGRVEAYLVDAEGLVVGADHFDLSQISREALKKGSLKNLVQFKLKPIEYGVELEVVSADSFGGERKTVEGARVFIDQLEREILADEEGIFRHQDILHPSSYLVRAEADGYWGTLTAETSQRKSYVRLFPENLLEQISKTAESKGYLDGAVIWGEIVDEQGRPLPQASIEVSSDQSVVHYFTKIFLDKARHFTGQNGRFMIFNLVEGTAEIRVLYGNKIYPAQILPVRKGFVTTTRLVISTKKDQGTPVIPFEVFTDTEIENVTLDILGETQDILDAPKWADQTPLKIGNQHSIVLDAGNDYNVMSHYSSFKKSLREVPVLDTSWKDYVDKKYNLQIKNKKIKFLGILRSNLSYSVFVDGQPLSEYLWDKEKSEYFLNSKVNARLRVLYFDQEGELIIQNKKKKGVKPYGFAILGLSEGFHSIQVVMEDGIEIYHHFGYISEDQVSSYSFNLPVP